MQREHRQLEPDAHGEEREARPHRAGIPHRRQPRRQVLHVQRAGHHVQKADADQDEGGSDGAHHQVIEGRGQRAAVAPHADQRVGRQRRDLQEHEHVEGIARGDDARQAGEGQHERGVEARDQRLWDLARDALPGRHHHQGRNGGDDKQHVGAQGVDAVFDPPGWCPAA